VRNNQIRYNVYGVTADSSSTPDLGTASSNGKNSLVSNTNACIVNNTTGTISAIGNYFAQADCYASPTCVSGLVDVSGWLCTPPLSAEWPVETVPKPSQIGLRLLGASPNPFVTATEIHFAVEKSDLRLQVELFNSSGRLVTTLRDHTFSRGTTSLSWDGRDEMGRLVPNGLYFVRFSTELGSTVGKIVVAR
jgi:hypothetical protein